MLSRKYIDSKGKIRHEYFKICPECNKQAWVKYKPESNIIPCRSCNGKDLAKNMHQANIKEEHEKVRYTRICVDCGDVRDLVGKPLTPVDERRCAKCARIKTGLNNTREYTRVCIICGDTKKVQGKHAAKAKYCPEHKHLGVDKEARDKKRKATLKINGTKTGRKLGKRNKPKSKEVPQEAIDRARQINKEHREALDKAKLKAPKQKLTDEEMMKQWLTKNKPTVVQATAIREDDFALRDFMN